MESAKDFVDVLWGKIAMFGHKCYALQDLIETRDAEHNAALAQLQASGEIQRFALTRIHHRLAAIVGSACSVEDIGKALILTLQDAGAAISWDDKSPEDYATCAECGAMGPACMCEAMGFPKFVPSKRQESEDLPK